MSDSNKNTNKNETQTEELNNPGNAQGSSAEDQGQAQDEDQNGIKELDLLKSRAKMMNIPFSNNIGLETLKQKIADALEGKSNTSNTSDVSTETPARPNPLEESGEQTSEMREVEEEPAPKVLSLREKLRLENMRLVRCRITNLDPKKKDLPGEIVTVANEYIGTVRKFIPFGEHTEEGFHIEHCIYKLLKSRRFLNIRTTRDRRTGTQKVSQTWTPEFALEVLPPLTKEELRKLAEAQIAAGSIENEMAA